MRTKLSSVLSISRFSRLLILALLLAATTAFAHSVTPRAQLDHTVILHGDEATVYVLIDFDVARCDPRPGEDRPDLNLAMVLDRSGSMDEKGKMDYARQAAKIVVDRMAGSDYLSIVEYDDEITVLWPAGPVEARNLIKRRIDELTPRGSTDLCGGMMEGVEEALEYARRADINRVILMSDGLANTGVTEPNRIYRRVREAKRDGITISTMGLGLDYNEDLMQGIAENGGGNYHFIEHPNQMGRIFEKELRTLFTSVAKDFVIRLRIDDRVKDVEVFGYESERDGRRVDIPLENFYSEEERSLLLKMTVDANDLGRVALGELDVRYEDLLAQESVEMKLGLAATVSEDEHAVERSMNEHVVVEATLTRAEEEQERITQMFGAGDYDAARLALTALNDDVAAANDMAPSARLSAKMEAITLNQQDLEYAAVGSDEDRSSYLKTSKAQAYAGSRGKRAYFMLEEGDNGDEVLRLQEALHELDLYDGDLDGEFDRELTEAVKEFQRRNDLNVDGYAGPMTMRALDLF